MILDQDQAEPRYLSYCTNVHPGESVNEVLEDLQRYAVPLRARFHRSEPFALGLRLSAAAIDQLHSDPRSFDRFSTFLSRAGFLAYTLNVFPFGGFHDPVVKEKVYSPPFGDPRRLDYVLKAASVLSRLLPAGERFGSLSTVPLGFPSEGEATASRLKSAALELVRASEALARLESDTGTRITIALEPEPACLLATVTDVVSFFQDVLDPCAESATTIPSRDRSALVRRYVGICYDVCHAAVEYQEPTYDLERLERSGIGVYKVQLSNALEIERPGDHVDGLTRLREFDEPRFLHQVSAQLEPGSLVRFKDLGPFLSWIDSAKRRVDSARCHFHVPIHHAGRFPLKTTQPVLLDAMKRLQSSRTIRHLEVETYSFDVLPRGEQVQTGLIDNLEAELRFARDGISRSR